MRSVFTLAALPIVAAMAAPVTADQGCCRADRSLVTAEGDAEVRVVPDEFVLAFGIETRGLDLAAVSRANEEAVGRVVANAKSAGAGERHIQTGYTDIRPRYDEERDRARPLTLLGYVVERSVVVTLTDPTKVSELRTRALMAGANHLYGLNLHARELRKHRDQARLLAVRAAREKAAAIAAELGQKIGRAHTINIDPEPSARGFMPSPMQNVVLEAGGESATDERFAPGQIAIRAKVRVQFELE
jgi:uncharacterized protein YggE